MPIILFWLDEIILNDEVSLPSINGLSSSGTKRLIAIKVLHQSFHIRYSSPGISAT